VPSPLPPAIAAHRLLSNGRCAALLRPDGEVDWWCAPAFDSVPLLWSLLDSAGPAARWRDARLAGFDGPPAGPAARTELRVGGARVEALDGLVVVDGASVLVRAVRACDEGTVDLVHDLRIAGLGESPGTWHPSSGGPMAVVADLHLVVAEGPGAASDAGAGPRLVTRVTATPTGWTGLAIAAGAPVSVPFVELVERLQAAEAAADDDVARLLPPRLHPERARDAIRVLRACTYEPTGAVIASPTTSLPEAPGADRQFDYRYCWLRDAALAMSVASLLGDRVVARGYLSFLLRMTTGEHGPVALATIDGGPVPAEREVDGVAGWAGSLPVRLGNAAAGQLQYDALGMVLEAVSVHLQTGGSLDGETWAMVRQVADRVAGDPPRPSNGIWELRDERWLVSADIGRWIALHRAIWIARCFRPWTRRRHWRRARDEARARVLGALRADGRLPQCYDGDPRADASALLVPLFGMVHRRDERAHALVDAVLRDLAAGPYLHRYEPDGSDGFKGEEGTFLPVTWWAVSALAALGRPREARQRLDELCATLPALLAEEVDPVSGAALGNVPLVWSHVEMARSLYVLDAAERRARWGAIGLTIWRLARYARLRWARRAPARPAAG
jgi:hypothetical protein